jgi:hypothetical protein
LVVFINICFVLFILKKLKGTYELMEEDFKLRQKLINSPEIFLREIMFYGKTFMEKSK